METKIINKFNKIIGIFIVFENLKIRPRSWVLLIFSMFIVAVLEMIGVAMIMPFISASSNPTLIYENDELYYIYNLFNFSNREDFLIFLGFFSFFSLLLSIVSRVALVYWITHFCLHMEHSLALSLFRSYIKRDYAWQLTRDSAQLSKIILSEVSTAVDGAILPLTQAFAQIFVIIVMTFLLIIIDPMLAFYSALFIILSTFLFIGLIGESVSSAGIKRELSNKKRFSIMSEAFRAIKEVKLYSFEDVFVKDFAKSSLIYSRQNAFALFLSYLPRYAFELCVFGGLLVALFFALSTRESFGEAISLIALYAFAGYRLMPSLQTLNQSFIQLSYSQNSLQKVISELDSLPNEDSTDSTKTSENWEGSGLNLTDVSFLYDQKSNFVLEQINLSASSGKNLYILGESGSGKTTLVEVICGLLLPSSGYIEFSGMKIDFSNVQLYQNFVAYAPQDPTILNTSILKNICFLKDEQYGDKSLLSTVCNICCVDQFLHDLPAGYDTTVGEAGYKLSGGQKQRISLARALYKRPKLIIIDEGLSGVSVKMEKKILSSINQFLPDAVVVCVTHRYSNIDPSDQVLVLENGKAKYSGPFSNAI